MRDYVIYCRLAADIGIGPSEKRCKSSEGGFGRIKDPATAQ